MSSVLPKRSSSDRPLGFLPFSFFVPLGLAFFLLSSEARTSSSAGWGWRDQREGRQEEERGEEEGEREDREEGEEVERGEGRRRGGGEEGERGQRRERCREEGEEEDESNGISISYSEQYALEVFLALPPQN